MKEHEFEYGYMYEVRPSASNRPIKVTWDCARRMVRECESTIVDRRLGKIDMYFTDEYLKKMIPAKHGTPRKHRYNGDNAGSCD